MPPQLTPDTPIENLYMIGEAYAEKLAKGLNINITSDLLYHFPFRYEDLSQTKKIAELIVGETTTLAGQILAIRNIRTKYGKQIQKATFTDGENTLDITWFNQPYLIKSLSSGTHVNLAGKVSIFSGKPTLTSPQFEVIRSQTQTPKTTHTGRLVPIYPETYGVSSKWLRSRIKPILKATANITPEFIPQDILVKEKMINLPDAIAKIHFPKTWEDIDQARKRLAFDELFLLQLASQQTKLEWQSSQLRHQLEIDKKDLKPFLAKLPFTLTDDQNQALDQIIDDLNKSVPMNRLLEGDVGSGKTVVAAAAIYLLSKKGLKSTLIAPTEVLATQHHNSLKSLLKPLGIRIGFFTGSQKSKDKLENYNLYLGTHALLFQDLPHSDIGLVIIDEQHRFGVNQRAKLIGTDTVPHVLSMTATPIPRTAALTLYGNLSLSLIQQMPQGRKKIKTWLVSEKKRKGAYDWVRDEINTKKTQAFFICPLIDPSEKNMMTEIKSAKLEFERLQKIYPKLKLGLMHGKLKAKIKNKIMQDFADHKLDILVSTSVIEVGIDIANATIMIIEGSERFGLAQLHQLRGRVGRGDLQSYCLLFSTSGKPEEKTRLKAMENTFSGIELAKLDLKLRGPGQIYGRAQSGFLSLKIASLSDQDLVAMSHHYAVKYLPKLEKFPLLQGKLSSSTIQNIKPN